MIAWIVSGSRHAKTEEHRALIQKTLKESSSNHGGRPRIIIHGNCEGVDLIVAALAEKAKVPQLAMPAQRKLGRAAGPMRNREMLRVGDALNKCGWAVNCFAFPTPDSKGTRDFISTAEACGFRVEVVELLE